MITSDTHNIGEYFELDGVRAYKYASTRAVTTEGKIYKLYKNSVPERKLSEVKDRYVQTQFIDENGVRLNMYIHQLVAKAFIDNPNNYTVVDHINEDKTDNRIENLRWTTPAGNSQYYNFKDNREIEELKQRNKDLAAQLNAIKAERNALERDRKAFAKEKEAFTRRVDKILEEAKAEVDKYAKIELVQKQYAGVVENKSGAKFGSTDAMIKATAKPVYIDGVMYSGIREATRYLRSQEDVTASEDTIRKEIRSLVNGKRQPWSYLGKYNIDTNA